jgi:hypothetical protein
MIDKRYDTNSYEYYNLGLAYAQVYDYNQAYKNFKKAYGLENGNKLYAVMTLLTAKRLDLKIAKSEKEHIEKNIFSKKGSYHYLAKYLYKTILNSGIKLNINKLQGDDRKSIFFRAIYFLEKLDNNQISINEPLLVEFKKDSLVQLLELAIKRENETDYQYISRLQDKIPDIYNNNYIKGSLVVTDYYLDILHALGLFYKTDFNIPNETSPSYLRTKAIVNLYSGNGKLAIKLIEDIQKRYNLESIESFYIIIASLFSIGEDSLAYASLSELELLYQDKDAKFLGGIKLIQDIRLNTIDHYFKFKLKGKLIDFKLENFDKFLENL